MILAVCVGVAAAFMPNARALAQADPVQDCNTVPGCDASNCRELVWFGDWD